MEDNLIISNLALFERSDNEDLKRQRLLFANFEQIKYLLDAIPEIFVILNDKRQVVFANNALFKLVGAKDVNFIYGQRPGEFLGCLHASESDCGCGTSHFCRTCGALNAIVSSLRGKEEIEECRILQKDSYDALDLRVWTTPYKIGNEMFTIFTILDISNETRRKVLERLFFHDILNTAGNILGFVEILKNSPEYLDEFKNYLYDLSIKLIEEIQGQRDLVSAENHELIIQLSSIKINSYLTDLTNYFSSHLFANNKIVDFQKDNRDTEIISDKTVLSRVLGNMLKNALEASEQGDTVTIKFEEHEESIVFEIHNDSYIPEDTQLQMFHKSFSTKGSGRGLGTYSMKLLGEKYLKGSVSFISEVDSGTTFCLRLPKILIVD